MTIATIRDAEEILALQKLAFLAEAELYRDFSIKPLVQTIEELRRDLVRQTVLKAVADGRIIGSVRGRLAGDTGRIGRLMVHPDHQRRGIGTGLVREIEDLLAPRCERFEIFTGHLSVDNIRLYAKLGYAEFRTVSITPELSLVYMEKRVAHDRAPDTNA